MNKNLERIIDCLAKAEQGLWIREIHRRTGLNPALIKYYTARNPEMFETLSPQESAKKPIFTLIKLKPAFLTKQGVLLTKILKETGK